ncbi:MAG: amidohydrolase family protein [Acidimicrobiales bacterium]
MHPTSFASILDLARLPWFDVVDGNRLVADPSVGPVIDMHTHLAMAYGPTHRVDVAAETPRTAHYMPITAPFDLEPYSNLNFDAEAMWSMKLDLSLLSLTPWGKRVTHTAPNLLREMDDLGITNAVLLPFDMPFGASNADVFLTAARQFPRLVSFAGVHPSNRHVDDVLDEQIRAGAKGLKFHPNGQFMAPDHPKVVHLCRRCGERNLPVLMHCGPVGIEPKAAANRSQVVRYEQVIAENPHTTFVLGHCGALQHRTALDFVGRYDNLYYELSSLGLGAMREVFDTVAPDRLVYGTDWPFYHQAITMARVLILTEGDEALRRAVLHDNAARLLGLAT